MLTQAMNTANAPASGTVSGAAMAWDAGLERDEEGFLRDANDWKPLMI